MPSDIRPALSLELGSAAAETRPVGLRERHKLAKLDRIAAAARALFGRQGYDGATLRDIAREADVALGTLSLYARDKRDLVLLIFSRVIPPLMEQGRSAVDPSAPLVDNLVAFFEPFYVAYAEDVVLYRTILGQIYNGPSSVHAEENDAIRVKLMEHLTELVFAACRTGECRMEVDPAASSRALFYLYFAAVRVWLFQETPTPQQGLADLRRLYDLHARGLLDANRG